MRSYVGIAVDATAFDEDPEDLLRLELEGFREVDLKDAKVTLMLLKWRSDDSPEASVLRFLIDRIGEEASFD